MESARQVGPANDHVSEPEVGSRAEGADEENDGKDHDPLLGPEAKNASQLHNWMGGKGKKAPVLRCGCSHSSFLKD